MRQKTKIKKLFSLRELWNETLKDYAGRTGLSQSSILEHLMARGDKQFRKDFRLDEEKKPDVKEDVKGEDAQGSSEERYMRNLIFEYDSEGEDESLDKMSPESLVRKLRKSDGWQEVEG